MSLDHPRFRKINEEFLCKNCAAKVPLASGTCRDHCPFCLWSLHVDENPGDRASTCGGMLRPVGYEFKSGKGYMILYKCESCQETKRNKFLEFDSNESDSFDSLLALTASFKDLT